MKKTKWFGRRGGRVFGGFLVGLLLFVACSIPIFDPASEIPGANVPAAPGLRATVMSATRIDLAWDVAAGAIGYKLYRAENSSGPFRPLTTLTATDFSDTDVSAGNDYWYRVAVLTSKAEGAKSSVAYAATKTPDAPTGVKATAESATKITVSWNPTPNTATYNVYRSGNSNGPFTTPMITGLTSPNYTDTTVSLGNDYYYKISAINVFGESWKSKTVYIATVFDITEPGLFVNDGTRLNLVDIDTPFSISKALIWLKDNIQSDTAYTIAINADEALSTRQSFSFSRKTGIKITLKGIGRERTVNFVSQTDPYSISVSSGVTFVLDDRILLRGGSVAIFSGGTLIMKDGAKISDNKTGGVYVSSSSSFIMEGGEISKTDSAYGGVCVDGGTGIFLMNGGKIVNNINTITGGGGGGVCIKKGSFTMSDGEISGNTAYCGGGVWAYGYQGLATFTMNGGEISGNTASHYGGGVYIVNGGGSSSHLIKQPSNENGTGGIIYGYSASNPKSNKVLEYVSGGGGHAVFAATSYFGLLRRETTVGQTQSLDSDKSGIEGGWIE